MNDEHLKREPDIILKMWMIDGVPRTGIGMPADQPVNDRDFLEMAAAGSCALIKSWVQAEQVLGVDPSDALSIALMTIQDFLRGEEEALSGKMVITTPPNPQGDKR